MASICARLEIIRYFFSERVFRHWGWPGRWWSHPPWGCARKGDQGRGLVVVGAEELGRFPPTLTISVILRKVCYWGIFAPEVMSSPVMAPSGRALPLHSELTSRGWRRLPLYSPFSPQKWELEGVSSRRSSRRQARGK